MEHDDDKKVREKVRVTESTPVTWNKSGVWDAISFPQARQVDFRPVIWYAAASVILAAGLTFYSLMQIEREKLQLLVGRTELAIEEARLQVSQVSHAVVDVTPEQVCPEEKTVRPTPKRRRALDKPSAVIQVASTPTEKPVVPDIVTVNDPVIMPVEATSEQRVPAHQATVKPIIGSMAPTQTARQHRLQLKIFQQDEEPATKSSTPVVFLAGTNKQ